MAGNVSNNFGSHATKEKLAIFAKIDNDDKVSYINSCSFKMTTPMPNFERIFLPLLLPNQICKQNHTVSKINFHLLFSTFYNEIHVTY